MKIHWNKVNQNKDKLFFFLAYLYIMFYLLYIIIKEKFNYIPTLIGFTILILILNYIMIRIERKQNKTKGENKMEPDIEFEKLTEDLSVKKEKVNKGPKTYNIALTRAEIENDFQTLISDEELQLYFRTQKKIEKYNQFIDLLKQIDEQEKTLKQREIANE